MTNFKPNTCETCALLHNSIQPCFKCIHSGFKINDTGRTDIWQPVGLFVEVERLRAQLIELLNAWEWMSPVDNLNSLFVKARKTLSAAPPDVYFSCPYCPIEGITTAGEYKRHLATHEKPAAPAPRPRICYTLSCAENKLGRCASLLRLFYSSCVDEKPAAPAPNAPRRLPIPHVPQSAFENHDNDEKHDAPAPDPCITCTNWVEYAGPPPFEGGNDHFCSLTLKAKDGAVQCIICGYKDRKPAAPDPFLPANVSPPGGKTPDEIQQHRTYAAPPVAPEPICLCGKPLSAHKPDSVASLMMRNGTMPAPAAPVKEENDTP